MRVDTLFLALALVAPTDWISAQDDGGDAQPGTETPIVDDLTDEAAYLINYREENAEVFVLEGSWIEQEDGSYAAVGDDPHTVVVFLTLNGQEQIENLLVGPGAVVRSVEETVGPPDEQGHIPYQMAGLQIEYGLLDESVEDPAVEGGEGETTEIVDSEIAGKKRKGDCWSGSTKKASCSLKKEECKLVVVYKDGTRETFKGTCTDDKKSAQGYYYDDLDEGVRHLVTTLTLF